MIHEASLQETDRASRQQALEERLVTLAALVSSVSCASDSRELYNVGFQGLVAVALQCLHSIVCPAVFSDIVEGKFLNWLGLLLLTSILIEVSKPTDDLPLRLRG